jgi:predicted NBD/HSP70 family sugar kinase
MAHPGPSRAARSLARANGDAILEALRTGGALSRQQLAERTGLSAATVSRLTSTLVGSGLVVPFGRSPSTGGRPPELLRYAGGSRVVAAVQVGVRRIDGALVDLDGQVTVRRTVEPVHRAGHDWVRQIRDLATGLARTAQAAGTPCLGVGVAVPGIVHGPDDRVAAMIGFDTSDVPLGRQLRDTLDLPVVVENDANALAFGELQEGASRGLTSLVGLFVDNGIGAGIITGGELHKGAHGEAGEIGYLLVERSSLGQSISDRGDLEDHIGYDALTRRAHERGLLAPGSDGITTGDVFRLAGAGNPIAREMADEILDIAAMAVAAMVIVLDPQLVVIGSTEPARDATMVPEVQRRLQGRIIHVPQLAAAKRGADAVLVGVARMAAEHAERLAAR